MIFIPYNVPSLKNSKVATSKGVFHSKTVKKYLQKIGVKDFNSRKKTVENYVKRPNIFNLKCNQYFQDIEYPVEIGFHFVRDSKREFDFHNAVHILADLLVSHRFIKEDSMNYFIPSAMKLDGKWYSIDKKSPGVYVRILNKG
jgi:hypothetical protein